ncbi:DegT/DnrJ/EryC1/StrS family aminotransferase [Actinoplanes aureus]|uniref:DegT/DnrJ/EryC1/StrS family aminotransferase n=1 Tax=Actinoplanes aureus TaxID=2792083 RepID=A0A931CH88_9ACTN|nr:aminotransferase class I/II-fold pyridoxal phosphate-dependent enzyme [Actinoplanes aureus]MBG0566103.1 DegT/DnrJ/EryC1/StrS family aminotransferase [Actinoplanes aureus]
MDFKDLRAALAAITAEQTHDGSGRALKDLQSAAYAALAGDEAHDEFRKAFVTKDDDEIADVIRYLSRTASPPAVSVVLSLIQDAVGEQRYAAALRAAGLGNYLDIPYTSTGAELTGEAEERYVLEALRSKRLWRYEVPASRSFVGRFEQGMESLLGVKHVHATVSGTTALTAAMLGLGVGPGDEVILPAVTWVGCADAVILCGAVPVIAQVDATLGISVADVARAITERTRAVMAVSLFGAPCDLGPLRALTDRHGIALLEDNAQAVGVSYRGRRLGGIGDAAIFSTKFMKFVAAGDGGYLATNSDELYQFAVHYTGGRTIPARKRAMNLSGRIMPATGLRMNELTGAVALAQLERLDELLGRLRTARDRIFELAGPARTYQRVPSNDPAGDSGWMTPLLFPDEPACQAFAAAVRARGIRHVTTSRELFAGGEIEHCYAAMSTDRYLPATGAHWATEFRAMNARVGIDARSNPWSHVPDRDYRPGFMDESLRLLRRLAFVQTNPRLEPAHCEEIAGALAAADAECAGG